MSEFTKFSVWEHIKTESDFNAYIETLEEQHAAALRQARIEALEEAAKALAAEDERHAEIIVRALKDKQP